jgi:hypothetical protein
MAVKISLLSLVGTFQDSERQAGLSTPVCQFTPRQVFWRGFVTAAFLIAILWAII